MTGKVSVNTVFFFSFFLIQDGKTPLHLAAQNDDSEVVTKLVDSGAEVDMKDNVRKGSVME